MPKKLGWLVAVGWLWTVGLTLLAWFGYGVRRHNFEAAGIAFGLGLTVYALLHLRVRTDLFASVVPRPSRSPWVVGLLPAGLAIVSFSWTAWIGPLSDDFVLAKWALDGAWVPSSWAYFRPLPLALWQGILSLSLSNGWGALHLLNVLLHASNSALVGHVGARWLGVRAGVAAGALFAMFPASVEAVAWGAGVFDLASTTCALGAVLLAQVAPPTTTRTCAIGMLVAAGLLTKETAVAIPALVFLVAAVSGQPRSRALLNQMVVAGGIALLYLVLRASLTSAVAGHLDQIPAGRRQWKDLLVRPFAALAVPMRSDLGVSDAAYLAGLLVLVLLAIAIVHVAYEESTRNNQSPVAPMLLVAVGWVSLTTLPLLLSFYVAPTLEGSRYLYLPSAGWALALSSGLAPSGVRWIQAAGLTALLLLLVTFAGRIGQEATLWLEAARVRDALVTQAARLSQEMSCRSLEVQDPPDAARGVFIFRQGLPEALAPVMSRWGTEDCSLRWTGSDLVPVAGP